MKKTSPRYTLKAKTPTVDEYAQLIESVGWKKRDRRAIRTALKNSTYSVCAVSDKKVIGMGRIIGDGGLHYYISDIVVMPQYQKQGIGTAIMKSLVERLSEIRYKNTIVGIMPTKGSKPFYEKFGFKSQKAHSPAMYKWLNERT